MSGVAAILLAAGASRRMAPLNKLLLPIGGEPLLRHGVRTLLASRLEEVVVVVGPEAGEVASLLADLPVRLVRNARPDDGQMSSVHAGLEALAGPCAGVMICLADQPLLTVRDIDTLIEAFGQRQRGSVLVPTHRGRRGNPIVLDYVHRADILGGGRNLGCRRLIERHPELVTTLEMDTDNVVFDLDTPDDYAEWQRRCGPARERRAVS